MRLNVTRGERAAARYEILAGRRDDAFAIQPDNFVVAWERLRLALLTLAAAYELSAIRAGERLRRWWRR